MSYAGLSTGRRGFEAAALAAALMLATGGSALAQDAPPAKEKPKAAAPAPAKGAKKAAAPAKGEKQSSWVKLCDQVPDLATAKDGKPPTKKKKVCATFHDTIDANSGMTVVSAAIREVEGDKKLDLQVTVPLGMVIPAGAKISALTNEQTELIKAKKDLDPKSVKSVDLKFTACLPNGCTAEVEAPGDILALMKKGGSLLVRSIYVSGKPFAVPVPLNGFGDAFAGKPTDNEVYKKARAQMMTQIRARQAKLAEKFKADKLKDVPPPPGFKEGEPIKAKAKPAADKK